MMNNEAAPVPQFIVTRLRGISQESNAGRRMMQLIIYRSASSFKEQV